MLLDTNVLLDIYVKKVVCDVSWFEDGLPRIVERELVFKIPKAIKVT